MIKLNKEQKDALKEIVSIGAGHAATAMSQMIKKKVTITVPDVNMAEVDRSSGLFGASDTLVTAVYLQMLGDLTGIILFSFPKDVANKLTDIMMGKKHKEHKVLGEMSSSAVKEVATILSGSYLSAIGTFLKMRLLLSAPAVAHDMAGAVVDNILVETSKEADYMIIVNTEFLVVGEKIMTYFFFIPDSVSTEKLMKAIGLKKK